MTRPYSHIPRVDDGDPYEPLVTLHPEPDQAWKALGQVNDWVKHAESKVGVTLAFSGVTGGMLFNIVKGLNHPQLDIRILAGLCALAVFSTGFCAAKVLLPKVNLRKKGRGMARTPVPADQVNLLFFSHIARNYNADGPSYAEVLHALTGNKESLTRQIALQVHANATVAQSKFTWVGRALRFLFTALTCLGALALDLGIRSVF